jgi:DMSO/TMAO reductase YedYZ molybdopterin-dependent catalytic subunit
VTGCDRRFPVAHADRLLLATHVGGVVLSASHGFPLRLVAPGRRGYHWVNWVTSLEVSDRPAWWQPPLPVQ